jgi:hypothetical protein
LVVSALSLFAAVSAQAQTPLDSTFTYQGELAAAGSPAAGTYDLQFRLYDATTGGTQIGSTLCSDDLAVVDGRFAASLDFGAAAFSGQKRFLEIEVRQDTGLDCSDASGYTLLSPRQELTATPNASFAQAAATATTATTATNAASLNGQAPSFYQNAANLTGTLADAQLSSNIARLNGNQTFTGLLSLTNAGNTFVGNGAGLTSLNGANIMAGTVARSAMNTDVRGVLGALTTELSLAGSVSTGSSPLSVAVSGFQVYVAAAGSDQLQVFDFSNPGSLIPVGSVATGDNPRSVAVSGSFAYVVNQSSNTLQVFNIGNPLAPTSVGLVATGLNPHAVAVSGSFAYVVNAGDNTLRVFSVSNPALPTQVGSVTTGSGPFAIAVSGSLAYVVNQGDDTLQVFDISNPAAPGAIGIVATGSTPYAVAVSGTHAYVVNANSRTLQTFSVANPAAPVQVGSISTPILPVSVVVSGSFAYVTIDNFNRLIVYNISNPVSPTQVASIATGTSPRSVAVSGSSVFVVNQGSSTLQQFSAPTRIGFSSPLASTSLVGVSGAGLTDLSAGSITSGTISNSRTTGTGLNTPSTLVLRDASGNFSAGIITATLSGTASNASNLNNQPASFYTNASSLSTGTVRQTVLPVAAWFNSSLPANTISSANPTYTTVTGTSQVFSMRQGVAVISWSTSAYTNIANTNFLLRIKAVTGGVTSFGPVTTFTFNQASSHLSISGNAVITIPSTASTTFTLEVARIGGSGNYVTDNFDSFTASITNIGQ